MYILNEKVGETPMTDMQTKIMMAAIAEVLASSQNLDEANERYEKIVNTGGTVIDKPMTDYQYKNFIEMIYQILKANFEAGKTPEEVLAIVSALKNESCGKVTNLEC